MKRLTSKQLNEQVQVTCYRETETMRREDAIDFISRLHNAVKVARQNAIGISILS